MVVELQAWNLAESWSLPKDSFLGINFMNFTKSIGPVDVKTEPNKLNPIDLVKICEDFDKRKYFGKFQCFAKFPACNSTTVLALQKRSQ